MTQSAQLKPHLGVGDHSPVFSCNDTEGDFYDFYCDVTGKPVVFIFSGNTDLKDLADPLLSISSLDGDRAQMVTIVAGNAEDVKAQKEAANWPIRTVVDVGGEVTTGFANLSGVPAPSIFVLCPNQRVAGITGLDQTGENLSGWLGECLSEVTFSDKPRAVSSIPPALMIPRVLDPEDCEWLIGLWRDGETQEGQVTLGASQGGRKAVARDMKRREDFILEDPEMQQRVLGKMMPRLAPELKKVLHFHKWSMEALRVGCYKASDQGFFNIHRDNTSPPTKDRKYAITINLNTGEYEGGDLRFPEYGNQLFCPPAGGAVVFSCSLLHEVLPVTSGERFTLLTFLR